MDKQAKRIFYRIPAAMAERPDLPASAKIIISILAFRIGRNRVCWPGIRKLAADAGINPKTAADAISRLEDAGEIIVERRGPGRGNRYRLSDRSCFHDLANCAPKTGTLTPNQTRTECPENGDATTYETGTLPPQNLGHKRLKNTTNTPPLPPPTGGNGGDAVSEGKATGKRQRLTPAEESELNVAIDRIGSAYHSTFGDAMPSPWRTDIVREFKTGNRASLSRINPERLASVAAACDDKKTIFCLSNVIRAIHAAARAAKIAEDIHRKTIEKSSQDAAAKAAEDKARAEAEEITTARVERFRKLPEVERDTWNTKALDLPGPPIKHLGRLERIAAMLYAEANEPNSNRPTAREGTA